MSAVSTARRRVSKDEVLRRKVPENPRYSNVKSVIDTGATSKKCLQHRNKDALKKQDEVFKRIKLSTFLSLAIEVSKEEINYGVQKSSEICLSESSITVPEEDKLSTLHSVINGIGEVDRKTKPNKENLSNDKEAYIAPYLLLDVRDPDSFQQCHIITAKNYPSSMLCRSCNYETKELLAYKNVPLFIIVLYDEDETVASRVAATLTQRGYDNVFMLSGGLKLAASKFPEGLVVGEWPQSCWSNVASNNKKIFRKASLPVSNDSVKSLRKTTENKFTENDLDKLQLELHRCFISQSESNNQSRATTARSTASRTSIRSTKPWK